MINWMYFPKNKKPDDVSNSVVNAFENVFADIDSTTHELKSDDVLATVRPGLEKCCFRVEKSKRDEDLVSVPVLFGLNG